MTTFSLFVFTAPDNRTILIVGIVTGIAENFLNKK